MRLQQVAEFEGPSLNQGQLQIPTQQDEILQAGLVGGLKISQVPLPLALRLGVRGPCLVDDSFRICGLAENRWKASREAERRSSYA